MSSTAIVTVVGTAAPMDARGRGLSSVPRALPKTNNNIPSQFVEAYYQALSEGLTDRERIRAFLIQKFITMQPAELRNLLIEGTLSTMENLPKPPPDAAEREAAARSIAGGGLEVPEEATFDGDEGLANIAAIQEAEAAMRESFQRTMASLTAGAPGDEPPPAPSAVAMTNRNRNNTGASGRRFQGQIPYIRAQQLRLQELHEELRRKSVERAHADLEERTRRALEEARLSKEAREAANRSRREEATNRARREREQAAEALRLREQQLAAERAEFERVQRENAARIQREAEALRARLAEEARAEQEAMETNRALLRGFPIRLVNLMIAADGHDEREMDLKLTTYTRPSGRPNNENNVNLAIHGVGARLGQPPDGRITLGEIFTKIVREARRSRNRENPTSDLTVHLLGLHALLIAISERVAVNGREDEVAKAIVSRLRHVSTFYHLQPLEPEVSRLLAVGPRIDDRQSMRVDPVIEHFLNLDLHPTTFTFLFPRVLANMRDSNMYQQGRILTVLYENNLNEYLDMRSMANMVHRKLNWIIRTYFAPIPTSPMEAFLAQPFTLPMVSTNYSPTSASSSRSLLTSQEDQEEWLRIYGPILARRGNANSKEYASRNYLDLLSALKNQLEAHEKNTRNYTTWDRLSSFQRVFFVWSSVTQIFGQAQQLHNRIQEGRAFQAALQAARNARANTMRPFDPDYVRAQGPRGPTANNRNFDARVAEGNAITDALSTQAAMESIYGDLVTTFGEVSDFRDGVSSNANGLPSRAKEAITDADADIYARCTALAAGGGDRLKLPLACGAGIPWWLRAGRKDNAMKVAENREARQQVVDDAVYDAVDAANILSGRVDTLVPLVENARAAMQAGDVEGFVQAVGNFNAGVEEVRTLAPAAVAHVQAGQNVVVNVENIHEVINAPNTGEVKRILLGDPSAILGEAQQARADGAAAEQAMADAEQAVRLFQDGILLVAVGAAVIGSGPPVPPPVPPPPTEPPREVNPEAAYVTAVLPGANVDPALIEDNVGTAPHVLKGTDPRGDPRYVTVLGKNLDAVHEANLNRNLPEGKQWRERAHEVVALYTDALAFAGDATFVAHGVPAVPNHAYKAIKVPTPFLNPGTPLRPGFAPPLAQPFIPGHTGGLDWNLLPENVVGLDPMMGQYMTGGYRPAPRAAGAGPGGRAGGGHRLRQTRSHQRRSHKTRKQRGGKDSLVKQICHMTWQMRTYADEYKLKVLLQTGLKALKSLNTLNPK